MEMESQLSMSGTTTWEETAEPQWHQDLEEEDSHQVNEILVDIIFQVVNQQDGTDNHLAESIVGLQLDYQVGEQLTVLWEDEKEWSELSMNDGVWDNHVVHEDSTKPVPIFQILFFHVIIEIARTTFCETVFVELCIQDTSSIGCSGVLLILRPFFTDHNINFIFDVVFFVYFLI